jgi:hypothetical protein
VTGAFSFEGYEMSAQTAQTKPTIFEPNEFYEQLLRERAADPYRYELSYSMQTKTAAGHYARAKRRAERGEL